jgi:peptidyl-prolyl cis-trans isomerase-like 4
MKKKTTLFVMLFNFFKKIKFLITLAENLDFLDGKHTIFGEVAKGLDILEKLNDWICDKSGRPYQDIRYNNFKKLIHNWLQSLKKISLSRIFHTVILDDPFDDFAALKELNGRASPEPTDERLKVNIEIK